MHSDHNPSDDRTAEQRWLAAARRTAGRVNLGWWLHHLLTPALIWAIAGAVAVLYARGRLWPMRPFALAGAAILMVLMLRALRRHRRDRFTLEDALVRLETQGHLHSRLTAAAAGIAPWPDFDARVEPGLAWRWRRLLVPPALGLLSLAAAFAVPIRSRAIATPAVQEPASWSQVEQWAETLAEAPIVQPEELQEVQSQLEALRRQPMEEWYGHSSLEAGDHLRDQLQRSISDLNQNLEMAAQTLEESLRATEQAEAGGPRDARAAEALGKEWKKALEGLRQGSLKIDPALARQLSQLDPSQLRSLTPEQLRQLQAKLAKGCKSCGACTGKKPGALAREGKLAVAAASCNKPGQGGVSRGRGDAPLTLSDKESQLGTTRTEGLSSTDFRDASLGDTLAIQNDRHEVDPAKFRGQSGGAVASAGGAGEAVWRAEVMPEEQRALERYFKTKQ